MYVCQPPFRCIPDLLTLEALENFLAICAAQQLLFAAVMFRLQLLGADQSCMPMSARQWCLSQLSAQCPTIDLLLFVMQAC